jgi:indolepyruvate ferredoxin oxidoreductase
VQGAGGLTEAAARSLFKLMAYKDEYEVARLYADPAFLAKLRAQFDGDPSLRFHLAPPLFARRDPQTGHPRKRTYGAWMLPVLRVLAKMRRLRGTPFDVFGRTGERKAERRDIVEFESVLARLAGDLDAGNGSLAVEIASLPLALRGYGHVKARNRATYAATLVALLARFRRERPLVQAAD